MGLRKKTCYTIECDMKNCNSLCNNIEAYVGPLDGLTNTPADAEYHALNNGFVKINEKKWCCPECANKLGYVR